MSRYPNGMTRADRRRIEGEGHYPDCPLHEDAPAPALGLVCACNDRRRDARDAEAERRWEQARDEGVTP